MLRCLYKLKLFTLTTFDYTLDDLQITCNKPDVHSVKRRLPVFHPNGSKIGSTLNDSCGVIWGHWSKPVIMPTNPSPLYWTAFNTVLISGIATSLMTRSSVASRARLLTICRRAWADVLGAVIYQIYSCLRHFPTTQDVQLLCLYAFKSSTWSFH